MKYETMCAVKTSKKCRRDGYYIVKVEGDPIGSVTRPWHRAVWRTNKGRQFSTLKKAAENVFKCWYLDKTLKELEAIT